MKVDFIGWKKVNFYRTQSYYQLYEKSRRSFETSNYSENEGEKEVKHCIKGDSKLKCYDIVPRIACSL